MPGAEVLGGTAPQRPPLTAWQARWQAWWQARLPRTDALALTQRNVYILPTRAGLMFALTLLVLLLASINYQLNLGYLLTFLLAGSGVVSMHVTHGTLRGLTLRLKPPSPVFAGESALLDVVLSSPDRARFGIGVKLLGAADMAPAWTDVPAGGQASLQIAFVPGQRGLQDVPALSAETRFPLGLFRAWTVWRPAAQVLAWPAPERPAAPLPAARPVPGGSFRGASGDGGDVEGVRPHRRGDALNRVFWKKSVKALEAGGELVSRDTTSAVQHELMLDWHACGTLPPEARLSRLAAWVEAAERAGTAYGLDLPGRRVDPERGDPHRRRCLETLALWR